MIIFGIHSNTFIVLPIRSKIYRSNTFVLFYKAKCERPKVGHASEVLRAGAHPIGIGRAICPGLSKLRKPCPFNSIPSRKIYILPYILFIIIIIYLFQVD